MKNKVFICGYFNFPRGSASSNYVQYLSKVFMQVGYQVIIISNINEQEVQNKERGEIINIDGIMVDPIRLSTYRIRHYLEFNFCMGKIIRNKLLKYNLNHNDIIISYSTDPFLNQAIVDLSKKNGIRSCACITEWFSSEQFSNHLINIEFYRYIVNFYLKFGKFDYVFPISRYIESYYKKKKCSTLCLPIMADVQEYSYSEKLEYNIRKIIYPANGMMKDSIKSMFKAINALRLEELKKLEFHICGISREDVEKMVSTEKQKCIGKNIIIHKWMKYSELVALYQQMHFLFIARGLCQMTKANFPSKVPESMCYGVIPVVSRVGDYTMYYLEDGKDSLIFSGDTERDCISAIRRILSLSETKVRNLSREARDTAVRKFDYRNWTPIIADFIEQHQ